MAKDISGNGWLFKFVFNGQVQFEATSLDQVVSFTEAPNLRFRLMIGAWDVGTIVTNADGDTQELLDLHAILNQYPGYEFVHAKWTSGSGMDIDWEYYHHMAGLVLDVWDEYGSTNGDGWILNEFPALPDCDWDRDVDFKDLAGIGQNWLRNDCRYCNDADFTGDGNVDELDLALLADHWLQGD